MEEIWEFPVNKLLHQVICLVLKIYFQEKKNITYHFKNVGSMAFLKGQTCHELQKKGIADFPFRDKVCRKLL